MKSRIFIILALAAFLLSGCTESKRHPHGRNPRRPSFFTPSSSGNKYEVMVVAEDSINVGYAGRALNNILDKSLLGLPQPEPQFHRSHIVPKMLDRTTRLFRNIIELKVGREFTHAKMSYQKDVHAVPQIYITIQAPNQKELSMYITEHTKTIEQLINSEEINRMANTLYYEHNIKFAEKVREMFGCNLYIPVDLKAMKVGDNFIWASDNGNNTIQNICIYSLPYVSEKMFMRGPYIALRNKVMKDNIPGDKPNQFMTTNSDYVWVKNFDVRKEFTMEARGLWEMENAAMGGPFVSHSRVDTINNRVIVVEGFVYAPNKMKRTMIRRLEAALYTLELPAQIKAEEEAEKD